MALRAAALSWRFFLTAGKGQAAPSLEMVAADGRRHRGVAGH